MTLRCSLKPSKPAEDLCRRTLGADELCGVTMLASGACLDEVKAEQRLPAR